MERQLGVPKGGSTVHVLVKVVTKEGGVETHRITRLTTATWKDADGGYSALGARPHSAMGVSQSIPCGLPAPPF